MPARVISEGTLRILGLLALASIAEPPTLIGFEEPENGIHPDRIGLVAELLRSRAEAGESQLIITTHSPILPEKLPDSSLLQFHKVGGATQVEPFSPSNAPLLREQEILVG